MGNSPEARNPDGSIKDPAATPPNPTPTPEPPKAADPAKTPEPPKADDKPALIGAPEKYTDFTAPEGHKVSAELVAEVTPLFRDLNLSQAGAQKLVDVWNKKALEAAEAPYRQFEDTRKAWRTEMISSDLGNGKDDLSNAVKANIGRAIESLPADLQPKFKEAMVLTGAGDNPAFCRAFNLLGARLAEGSPVTGSGPSSAGQNKSGAVRPSAAQALFPNLPSDASNPRAG